MKQSSAFISVLAGSYSLQNATLYGSGSSSTLTSVDVDWVGILTYTPWGYMSTVMSATDPQERPLGVGWPPRANDSTDDWALVGKNAFSIAGRFRAVSDDGDGDGDDVARGQVIHGPIEVASVPSFVGTTEERNYTVVRQENGAVYLGWHLWLDDAGSRASVFWKRI